MRHQAPTTDPRSRRRTARSKSSNARPRNPRPRGPSAPSTTVSSPSRTTASASGPTAPVPSPATSPSLSSTTPPPKSGHAVASLLSKEAVPNHPRPLPPARPPVQVHHRASHQLVPHKPLATEVHLHHEHPIGP